MAGLMPVYMTWTNKARSTMPDWVSALVLDGVDPNGTFLILTPLGQARVHVGNVVLEREGKAWTCHANEVAEFLRELDEAEKPAPPKDGYQIKQGPEASVADRTDDTDDISARIAMLDDERFASKGLSQEPQISAPHKVDSHRKEITRPATAKARTQPYPAPLGSMPTIEWIHVARLSMDATYQRSTDNDASRRLITSIAAKFDWRLCAPLVVSRRPDGSMAVIDGQHRTLAAKKRGDIPQLPCCVFSYEGPEEEARMFIAANRARKPMNRLDDFHAALAAGDDVALEVRQIVTDAGLSIARNTASQTWKPGELACTASIASALRKHGAAIVSAALVNIAEAFPDQILTNAGSIFGGLLKVLTAREKADPDRLFQALLKYDQAGWGSFVQGLKGGDTRAVAMRDAMMMAYDETPAEELA